MPPRKRTCRRRVTWHDLPEDMLVVLSDFLWPREMSNLGLVDRRVRNQQSRRTLEQLHSALKMLKTSFCRPWPVDVYLTGSALLWALLGGSWTPNDVDLFVPLHRPTIQAAQHWLVTSGYRISKVWFMHTSASQHPIHCDSYNSCHAVITWYYQPQPIKNQLWNDNGVYSDFLRDLGADVSDQGLWVPRYDQLGTDEGYARVQLIVGLVEPNPSSWSEKQFLHQLLRFDFPILENCYDGRQVTVLFPEDVRTGKTVQLSPNFEQLYSSPRTKGLMLARQSMRRSKYQRRGIQIADGYCLQRFELFAFRLVPASRAVQNNKNKTPIDSLRK